MVRKYHEHFYRFKEVGKYDDALKWISENCVSYCICREVGQSGNNPHYHAYIKTTLAEKGWMQQMNTFGIKGANHSCKEGGWKEDMEGEWYIAKGVQAPYERSPPNIVLNNRWSDEEIKTFHEKFWEKNHEIFKEKFPEGKKEKKKNTVSWGKVVTMELCKKYENALSDPKYSKCYDSDVLESDILRDIVRRYVKKGDERPYIKKQALEIFRAVMLSVNPVDKTGNTVETRFMIDLKNEFYER